MSSKIQSVAQQLRETFPKPPRKRVCPSPMHLGKGNNDPVTSSVHHLILRKLLGIKGCKVYSVLGKLIKLSLKSEKLRIKAAIWRHPYPLYR